MSVKPKLTIDDAPRAPLYAEGDIVSHKASKQAAVILCARVAHDKSCPCAHPCAGLALNLPPCDCPTIFTGEYEVSIGFHEETVVDECVLESP